MAGKKENLKALFTNTRTRVIIAFTVIVLIFAVVFGITKFVRMSSPSSSPSSVGGTPNIQSIPGALNPIAEYAKLQEEQNVTQASAALKSGSSAIPTIVSSKAAGSGVRPIGSKSGQGGVGFTTLARGEEGGQQQNAWLLELQNSDCSNAAIKKVKAEGAPLSLIKKACTCIQIKGSNLPFVELEKVCSCKELKAAGVSARELKSAGFTAGRLRDCGFDACELKNAGFTAQEMKDGGFTDGEMKGAGFDAAEISKASGLPDGVSEDDIRKAGCGVTELAALKAKGVTAAAIRRISGCTAAQLKAAGFSAEDLMKAGFTAAELRKAGFSPKELRDAGFSARELLNAGLTPEELAQAGFSDAEINAAENELPAGITADDIKKAGCDPDALKAQRLAGVSAKSIKQISGCSAEALKEAGFGDAELARAGFSPEEIAAANKAYEAATAAIKKAGCGIEAIKALKAQGISASRIRELNGCSAQQLKAAGYDAKALMAAGFSPEELAAAGFNEEEIKNALATPTASLAAGRVSDCSQASLKAAKAAGISATTIRKTLGCSAQALRAAGYDAAQLRAAGFSAAELKDAGFTPEELKTAGFSAKELKDAGFTAQQLKNLGFSPKDLKEAGFTAKDLMAAGFSPAQLKGAGFSAQELKAAGLSAKDLKAAGFSAGDLKDAGFSAADLKGAGFAANELKAAGYSNEELKAAGINIPETEVAGLVAKSLAAGGTSGGALLAVPAMPSVPGGPPAAAVAQDLENKRQLQEIISRQKQQAVDQKYKQEITQRTAEMLGSANQALGIWRQFPIQAYVEGTAETKKGKGGETIIAAGQGGKPGETTIIEEGQGLPRQKALIRTGDILYATIDTFVDSDEPSPVLATVVAGRFRGAKLIGNFSLPSKAKKMIITFNMMSVPGADRTTPISAVAIDMATARTAISSKTNKHILARYGALFASSFLQGFGNAFQSANTTVTIGGSAAGAGTVTVANGVGRSALENAVIGLSTLGQNWAQVAQQAFNRPTTVQVYSGAGIGVLFTQDIFSL